MLKKDVYLKLFSLNEFVLFMVIYLILISFCYKNVMMYKNLVMKFSNFDVF